MSKTGDSEKWLGEGSTLLGLSEIGVLVLDAIGRWQLLADLTSLPVVHTLLNPYGAAVFIFVGSVLLARSREKEFEEAFKLWSTPILHGVDRLPPKRRSVWKMPVTLLALATLIAGLFVAVRLLLYEPPPPVTPIAFIGTRDDLLVKANKTATKPVTHYPASTNQNCPGGICAGGSISGSPTVNNFVPADRHLSADQVGALTSIIRSFPQGVRLQVYTPQAQEPYNFGKEISDIAGREQKGEDLLEVLEPLPKGTYVLIKSQSDISFNSALLLANTMAAHGIPVKSFEGHDYIKPGIIRVVVGEPASQ